MVLWQRSACLACPLVIATESCESLNELWNSLVVVARSHVENRHKLFLSVPDLWKPLALVCDPTRDKVVDEPNIRKWKMRCEHCNSM